MVLSDSHQILNIAHTQNAQTYGPGQAEKSLGRTLACCCSFQGITGQQARACAAWRRSSRAVEGSCSKPGFERKPRHTHGLKHNVSERIWILARVNTGKLPCTQACGAKLPLQSSNSALHLLLHSYVFQHHSIKFHFSRWPTDSRMTHLSG